MIIVKATSRTVVHTKSQITIIERQYVTRGVLPNVKVPTRVKLPPVDDKIKRKVRTHISCVIVGGMLAVLITFLGGAFIHWAPFLPTLPNALYEFLDRVYNR